MQRTDKVGVDHVVEVGGAGTLPKSVNSVRVCGRIALIGVLSGGDGLDPARVLMKSVRLQGIFVGSRRMFEEMNRAIALSKLQPVIDKVFAVESVQEALQVHGERFTFRKDSSQILGRWQRLLIQMIRHFLVVRLRRELLAAAGGVWGRE